MEFLLKEFENAINVSRLANIHYFEFTEKYHTSGDRHGFCELVYVDSGFITADADSYRGVINENQLIIHLAGEKHSLSCPENEAASVIIIGFECSCPELDYFSKSPFTLGETHKRLLTEIIKEGRSVFLPPYDLPNQRDMKKRADFPFGADQLIKIKLENLLIELIRSKTTVVSERAQETHDDKIQQVRRYLDDNFAEPITLSELCFLFETNKTTLCNKFRDEFSQTVIAYVNSLRIKEAKRLMRGGSRNLTEIAEAVGFSSVHYFSRIFKQSESKSPTSYIKTIKSRLML